MRTSLAVVALAASLAAQTVTVTSTACTDGQMTALWTFANGSPGADLVVTSYSWTQGYMGELAILVLSVNQQGCGVPLSAIGLGPSCLGVPNDIPGPIIFDPLSIVSLELVPVLGRTYAKHDMTIPQAVLPAVGSLDWSAQFVIYQSPQFGECWQATGNALRFSASR